MGLFKWDSKFWQACNVITYYVLLNIFSLIFSIPVFTAGAAISAKYYMAMKLARGEEVYIFKTYLKAFKSNFKQATKVWFIQFVIALLLAYDFYLILSGDPESYGSTTFLVMIIVSVVFVMVSMSCYGLMARFEMKTFDLIKGAITFTILKLPFMVFAAFLLIAPFILCAFHMELLPAILALGPAATLYIIAAFFVKSFKQVEERVEASEHKEPEEPEDDGERIFSDKLDESLIEK